MTRPNVRRVLALAALNLGACSPQPAASQKIEPGPSADGTGSHAHSSTPSLPISISNPTITILAGSMPTITIPTPRLPEPPPGATPAKVEPGACGAVVITLPNDGQVHFAQGSWTLPADAGVVLGPIVQTAVDSRGTISIQASASAEGTSDFNDTLLANRSAAVEAVLRSVGTSGSAGPIGLSLPITITKGQVLGAPGDPEQLRATYRKVVIIIAPPLQRPPCTSATTERR